MLVPPETLPAVQGLVFRQIQLQMLRLRRCAVLLPLFMRLSSNITFLTGRERHMCLREYELVTLSGRK